MLSSCCLTFDFQSWRLNHKECTQESSVSPLPDHSFQVHVLVNNLLQSCTSIPLLPHYTLSRRNNFVYNDSNDSKGGQAGLEGSGRRRGLVGSVMVTMVWKTLLLHFRLSLLLNLLVVTSPAAALHPTVNISPLSPILSAPHNTASAHVAIAVNGLRDGAARVAPVTDALHPFFTSVACVEWGRNSSDLLSVYHRLNVLKVIITTHFLGIPVGNHIYTISWGKIEGSFVFLTLCKLKPYSLLSFRLH
jgi:hypothetical protein